MARELGAGDRVQITDGRLVRWCEAKGLSTKGVIERVLDPLLADVRGERVLRVRFDDGKIDDLARRQVRRLR